MKLFKKIKKVYIASDHAGYSLKQLIIKEYMSKKGVNFQDLGTNSEKSVDYPKFAISTIIENGGWGSKTAMPISMKIFYDLQYL